jgi:hypothetical protein
MVRFLGGRINARVGCFREMSACAGDQECLAGEEKCIGGRCRGKTKRGVNFSSVPGGA